MSVRWLFAGPLAGLGAVSGVIAAFPDTHHRPWWVAACGIGAGMAVLIGLLPSGDRDASDFAPVGTEAVGLKSERGGVTVGQQYATDKGIAVGLLHHSGIDTALRASRDIRIGSLNVNQNPSSPEPPRKVRIWTIPPAVSNFIGRQAELKQLHQQLTSNMTTVLVPTTALYGSGGIGKTQLALAYASLRRSEYELGWWVPAETRLSILASFSELAEALGLPEGLTSELLPRRIHEELINRENWLLIFDNAPDLASVVDFLPRAGRGHVVVTSRSIAWRSVADLLPVDVMSSEDAVTLLTMRTGESDRRAALALAEALGSLPLALEQAAEYANSFLAHHSHPLVRYMEMFEKCKGDLLARGIPLSYEGTVDAIFSIAIDKVGSENSAAVQLLELCAFLAPEQLPLTSLLEMQDLLPVPLNATAFDLLMRNETIAALLHMGILTPDVNSTMRMHRLMQAVVLARQTEESRNERLHQIVAIINVLMPTETWEPSQWPRALELLPHVEAAVEHADTANIVCRPLAVLLTKLGTFLWARGLGLDRAIVMHERALEAFNELNKGDDFEIALAMYNLGADLRASHRVEEARRLHTNALEMLQRLYPGDHAEVARALNALAIDMSVLNEVKTAYELHERALEMRKRLYESDHPDIATSMNDLANDALRLGELKTAQDFHVKALAMRKRLYSGDHPDIGISLHNVARVNVKRRQYLRAMKLYKLALGMFRRLYDGDHPYIAITLFDLGRVYQKIGLRSKKRILFDQGLKMEQRLYPGDSEYIVDRLITVGRSYLPGRKRRARQRYEEALRMAQNLYPGDHLQIVLSLACAGGTYSRRRQRRKLYEQALAMSQRLYPNGSQVTASLVFLISATYFPWQRQALKLCEQCLAIERRLYQSDHAEIVQSLAYLAVIFLYRGHFLKAIKILHESFLMMGRILKSKKAPSL